MRRTLLTHLFLSLTVTACTGADTPHDTAPGDDVVTTDTPDAFDAPVDDVTDTTLTDATDVSEDTARSLPTRALTIGLWCGVPRAFMSADRFVEIAQAGFTVASNPCEGGSDEPTYNQQMLDFAQRAGLTVTVSDGRLGAAAAGTNVATNLDGVVRDYGMAPALGAYFLVDEPSTAAFPAIATAIAGLRTRDAAHIAFANLLPNYASAGQLGTASYDDYLAQFVTTTSPALFTYDHYNFLSDGSDAPAFFPNLASARAASIAGHVPFGQYIQSISYNGHRDTTGPEKRWAAMHTLAYGGSGVFYFTYWTPSQTAENFGNGLIDSAGHRTAQYADVTSINHDIAAIGRYTSAAVSTGVFHNGALPPGAVPREPGASVYIPNALPITVGMFDVPGTSDRYALVVNRDHDAAHESDLWLVSVDGSPEALDTTTGAFVAMPITGRDDAMGVRVHVNLAAGDGVLLHLRGPVPRGAPGAEVYYGSVRADAGWLDVVDSRFGTQRVRTAGWNECPAGYTVIGRDFQSNGFWLCARAEVANRAFYVGNVVNDAGNYYRVQSGTVTSLGGQGWDTCTRGSLLGHRFESNGFWLCME